MMVTPEASPWKPEVQVVWAVACALEPMPLSVPERLDRSADEDDEEEAELLLPAVELDSLAAHDESARAPTAAIAATEPIRLMFTGVPSGLCCEAGGSHDPHATVGTTSDRDDDAR